MEYYALRCMVVGQPIHASTVGVPNNQVNFRHEV
jgi:hypothetical protein